MTTAQSKKFGRDKAAKVVEGLIAETVRIYEDSQRMVQTHQERLTALGKLKSSENWTRLPAWAEAEYMGAANLLYKQYEQRLFWTHVLDGVRMESHDLRLDGRHGELDQVQVLSAHCWAVVIAKGDEARLLFIPFGEAERQQDLESERLTPLDIEQIRNPYQHNVKITHLVNDMVVSPIIRTQMVRLPVAVGERRLAYLMGQYQPW